MIDTIPAAKIAFVAGATGYTGRHVVAALRGRGVRTLCHVRPDSGRLVHWRRHFEALGAEVDTTPWQADAMAKRLATLRADLVFGLLGTSSGRAARARDGGTDPAAESYDAVDVGLTVLLADAARSCTPTPRFVYLSSLGVGPSSRGAYLQARWRVEEHLRAAGIEVLVARPSFISGADRDDSRPIERVGSRLVDGLLGCVGALGAAGLRDRYASMNGAALGEALAELALRPSKTRFEVVEASGLRAASSRAG